MKKILVSIFLLLFGLYLIGCENIGIDKLLRNQAGYKWLDDIKIENIEKVQIEFGGGMTYIGNTRSIYSSIEPEVIKDVFDYYYNCKVEQYSQDNEGVMDAGSEHTKFYLKTGEVKEITVVGIYLIDSNNIDFKVKDPYRMDESKFVRTFKFETDEEYGKLYEYTPIMEIAYIGEVPISELEFFEMMDEISLEGVISQYYIETNFGKIHFLLDVYFWVEKTNVSCENGIPIYYQLCNTSIYDLKEKYMNLNNEEIYKLTIQNETDYELIGIKDEYKAGEVVEVKMYYEDDVCTFAFLDGESLGVLTGIDSLKFNMPAKDSVLTISYSKEIYRVNVIDNFDLLIIPLKQYYAPGKTIQVITKFLSGPKVDVQVDGQYLEFKELENFGCYGCEFIMPEKDVEITILYNGFVNHPCENNEHQWDEGREIEGGNGVYVMKYICEVCGASKEEIITIIPPEDKLFYSLQEAFNNHFLSYEDLQQILNFKNKSSFNPIMIDKDIATIIVKDFCKLHNVDYEENAGSVRFFGEYNGYYAVMVDGCGLGYLTVITQEVVSGITFTYSSSQHILIWKYHE